MRTHFLLLTLGLVLSAGCDPGMIIDELHPWPPRGVVGPGPGVLPPPDASPPEGCQCSRRPGPLVSPFKCPTGMDQSATGVVGPEGGTVALAGQQAGASGVETELELAPGTVAQATKFSITELSSPPPAGFIDYSPVFRFDPPWASLARPARVRLPWSNMDGEIDRTLSIYHSDTGQAPWQRLETQSNAGFTDVTVSRLGYFFMGHPDSGQPAHCR